MGFRNDLARFRNETNGALDAIASTAVFTAHKSITIGSVLTGAPGQPVQTGRLRNSWQIARVARWLWQIASSLKYARSIEDGVSYAHGGSALVFRSKVGGPHSLYLTIRNWDRIVEDSVLRVARTPRFALPGAIGPE